MKFVLALLIFTLLSLPVFSQQVDTVQRARNLGTSVDTVLTRSTNNLRAFDQLIDAGHDTVTFSVLRRRHESLTHALGESEIQLHFLIRTNSRMADITAERNNYQRLINDLETLKADLDNYIRSIQ
ncbi:MAG: hypothetical protein FWG77_07125 [Treponema sp.]|nr:hypothetical protein [Treponema sp.]